MFRMNVLDSSKSYTFTIFLHLFISYLCYNPTDSGAVSLTSSVIDTTLATNELVFINFYADWCKFSNMLQPIFDEAAVVVRSTFPNPGQVVMGKVDCDKEVALATRFHITKYPTLKVIRNGHASKREYRGKRSVEAFVDFIKKQLEDPIKEFGDLAELKNLDSKKRIIIGFFDRKDVPEYNIFRRSASILKDDCQFHVGFGDVVRAMHPPGQPIVVFRPDVAFSNERDETFNGSLLSYDEVSVWMAEKCIPLVRQITFENAEELTEEGLPFLILFHKPEDEENVKLFKDICATELIEEKQNINFLTADGNKFAHPLQHLGKSSSDLPLIAIDSFRHMYLFPGKLPEGMLKAGELKRFIKELFTGKLHREFHYGPDPVSVETNQPETAKSTSGQGRGPTTPPESTFKKLGPSKNRYTLLRDEL